MNARIIIISVALVAMTVPAVVEGQAASPAVALPPSSAPPPPRSPSPPPPTLRHDVVETLHGVKVADPYRWLENGDAPAVQAWTATQNAYTRQVLDALPGRTALQERLWSLHEIGSIGAPVPRPLDARQRGRGRPRSWRYFHTRREGKQNQPVLYVRDGLNGTDRVLLDVNALAADGTRSLDWWFPSEDGRRVAYGVSADGSEESVLRVRDVQSGADLADVISRTRACSLAWLPDGSGFYYTRYPLPGSVPDGEQAYHRRVFFHRVGAADPEADPLVFGATADLKDWPSVALSPNGRFLAVEVSQGWSKSELHVLDRSAGAAGAWTPVAVGREAIFDLAELTNDALFIRTNEGAPRYRLMRVALPLAPAAKRSSTAASPPFDSVPVRKPANWREIIPEGPAALQQVALAGKTLAALYLDQAASRVTLLDLRGGAVAGSDVALPALGTVAAIYAHPEGAEFFLPFTSFLSPTTILRQSLAAGGAAGAAPARDTPVNRHRPAARALEVPAVWLQIPSPLPADAFVVRREHYASKDGTQVPLFLVHRRDLVPHGDTPTVLYGYGGFNVNITPGWAPSIVPFLERGGVYAVAVLRGGGEFGEGWHQAGMLAHKQNVFDDFLAAAKHLITAKVTNPARLAILGRSNGGLLVGAALTQRPDLFRAAISGVPLLDMLRYHQFRIAKLWIPEYGSADDPDAFQWLHAYSPYHRVRDGVAYPAVMLVTAASDTRVDPLHARKMTARLQAATSSGRPVLLRLETQAGHGAGKPLAKVIAELVDEWSFLFAELEWPPANPSSPSVPSAPGPR